MDESRMPISCANCSHTYGGYCNLTGKDFEDELSRRNKDCPLMVKKKIANAKPTSWLTDGLTKEEIEEALAEGKERSRK